MKYLLNIKFILLMLGILVLNSINVFALNNENEDVIGSTNSDILSEDTNQDYHADDDSLYDYQSYADIMRKSILQDSNVPLEERVYSEYNMPFQLFEGLSERVIISLYNTEFSLSDTAILYDGMGYTKTAGFVRALDSITTDKINAPNFKSTECYVHNGKYETRSVLVFPNGDTATVNISYDKSIPYLYFADNIEYYNESLSFDKIDNSMGVLNDYCVAKGENLSQYADMDEFIRNFILGLLGIFVLIIIVTHLNKKTNKTETRQNIETNNVAVSNDTQLVAILTAAIAAYENTSANGIKIKTIKKNIRWKNI